jgi:hypothetical protein
MHIPKRYGESKLEQCPFCGKQAIAVNKQKIPVCEAHRTAYLDDLKCMCGNYLDTKIGKFGVYFSCIRCGNLNLRKALELNPPKCAKNAEEKESYSSQPSARPGTAQPASSASAASSTHAVQSASSKDRQKPKELIISTDDPRYFG